MVVKIQLPHIIVTAFIVIAAVTSSYAQDSTSAEVEIIDIERDKDRMLYSPGEGDIRYVPRTNSTPQFIPKDSLMVIKSTPPAPRIKSEQSIKAIDKQPHPHAKDDDSILSFNFLYYIIQKYKLQDIID